MLHTIYQVPFKPVFLIPPESFFKWQREKQAIAPAQEFRPFGAWPMHRGLNKGRVQADDPDLVHVFPGVRRNTEGGLYMEGILADKCACMVNADHGKTYSTPSAESPVLRVHRPDGSLYEARE